MAGINGTRSFPFHSLAPPTTKMKPSPLSLSPCEFRLFGPCLNNQSLCRQNSPLSLSYSSSKSAIKSRYGGGGPQHSKRKSNKEEDQALDIFSISSATVRLIDQQQNMVGIVSKNEAIQMAEDEELDLVILSPDADPPVVRIMDYSKYRYEQQKKKKEQQKKVNRMDLKELKMGYNIDEHDYSVRLRAARKFLNDGDKVKVIVNLKGRQNEFKNVAVELLRRFQNDVGELATEESKNFTDRNMFLSLVPNKAVIQKAQEPPKKKDKSAANEVSAGV
ncbi:translation initiation factor IF-3 chloroplastic-like [Tripterygium wilfordii]|uniref:Translation initiation factor IF-3 n=1 Tax=Tripterygium wilfordii TaxID=458696 RepID=A0A7J7D708_TRIWF|nr:translation initiation factor IF3-4, chloroplastic-like [Tripterygium wilfordii]KAF5742093.1 translation initiation factor IF-3 chloroplastic-like [Tripterygium wilfordii]